MAADSARGLAAAVLLRVAQENSYAGVVLDRALADRQALSEADRALCSRLVYGVLERRLTLDYLLARHCRTPLRKLHPVVLTALRLGGYQLVYMDKIPPSAAVNEAVKLVRQRGIERSAGLVNGVLRALERDRGQWFDGLADDEEGLSVRWAVPVPLLRLWSGAYGPTYARQLAETCHGPAPTYVRINTLRTTVEAARAAFEQAGCTVALHPWLEECLELQGVTSAKTLAQIDKSWYYTQDSASQLCCAALQAQPGDRVADVCAAPGGKSLTLAQIMHNRGRLCAGDIHPARCATIAARSQQFGATIIETAARDAAQPCPSAWAGAFDRVLCDVPCSGLGVIRRKPEIADKPLGDFDTLPEVQYAILTASAALVRPGGVLQYSTCTLNPAENEAVAARFLAEHADFRARTLPLAPCFAALGRSPSSMLTLFPSVHGSDGFFIAGFVRTE